MADANVGTIEYDARINTKQLSADADAVENKLADSGNKGGSAFAGAITKATAATAAGFGVLAGLAVKSFANYEQLVGGVETLFKTSAPIIEDYAKNAYRTAGLSANAYMSTVTSFSASLLQGLKGDTVTAAKVADMAVTDMADNANKMGTSIESIQFAYQGFAKDNFTMLDNLKLGYGGTAEEMARLVNDSGVMGGAFKATAENVKDIPFDKLIQAIHTTQTEMGITGTTAKEASSTISGSWNSLKGAFENVLTGVDGSGKQLSDSLLNMFDQLAEKVPEIIMKMVDGLGEAANKALEDKFGKDTAALIKTIAVAVTALGVTVSVYTAVTKTAAAVQAAFNAVAAMNPYVLIAIALATVTAALVYFFTKTQMGQQIIQNISDFFTNTFIPALQAVGQWFVNLWNTITSVVTGVWNTITGVFNSIVDFFQKWGLTILAVLLLPFSLALGFIIEKWATISGFFAGVWQQIVDVFSPVIAFFTFVWGTAWNVIKAVWDFAAGYFMGVWNEIVYVFGAVVGFFSMVFGAAWNAIKAVFGAVGGYFQGVWNNIVSIFGAIGGAIGDALGGAFKAVINKVVEYAVGTINGFIRAINAAIGTINHIPGVKIGTIGYLPVPKLAKGGIVPAQPGGILANIGEGKEAEAVIPLSKLDDLISNKPAAAAAPTVTYNINMSGVMTSSAADERTIARRLLNRINEEQRARGLNQIGVA